MPKFEQLTLSINKKKSFKNILLSALFILLHISKQFGRIIKNKNLKNVLKKKNFLNIKTKLLKKNLYYFLDNLISIILPLNTELHISTIQLIRNRIYNWSVNKIFNFLELEEFFDEQKERNLVEKFLFIDICINFIKNILTTKSFSINPFFNLMRLPIKTFSL